MNVADSTMHSARARPWAREDAFAVRGLVDEDAHLGVGLEAGVDDDRAAVEVAEAAGAGG
jgi:hypothetical protein